MQYTNAQSIKTISTVTKATIAILTVLLLLPVLGTFPTLQSLFPILFVIWVFIILLAYLGVIDELYISLGHGWIEILRKRFISTTPHRTADLSINEDRIVTFSYRRFLIFRTVRITYKDDNNATTSKAIGLTMVCKAKRHEFIRELKNICKRNNNIQ